MRLVCRLVLVPVVLVACKGDKGDDFPECDTGVEAEFVDELELNQVGIEAYRYDTMGAFQYVVYIHGDDPGTTQMTITFDGVPELGMAYEATDVMGTLGVPVVLLLPDNETTPDLVRGTIEFTDLGMDGGILGLDIRLEFANGVFEGCLKHPLSVFGGGTDSGSDTGADGTTG